MKMARVWRRNLRLAPFPSNHAGSSSSSPRTEEAGTDFIEVVEVVSHGIEHRRHTRGDSCQQEIILVPIVSSAADWLQLRRRDTGAPSA